MEAEVSKELECVICQSVMSNPRVLACQHTLCLRCIRLSSESEPGSTRAVVKCPYNCGHTEVPDVRSLPKNTIVTNLCHTLRERQFEAQATHHCDECSVLCRKEGSDPAAEGGTPLKVATCCKKCSAILCEDCVDAEAHAYLCRNDQVFYPFFYGWAAGEQRLRDHLARRGHGRNVSVVDVERVYAPCHVLRVDSSVEVGAASTRVNGKLLSFASDVLPEAFRAEVEASDYLPMRSPQFAALFKLQEVLSRQQHLLRALRALLRRPALTAHLQRHSDAIEDHVRWDGGCANDCAVLTDMLLIVYKQLCVPLARKVRVLAALEGLRAAEAQPAQAAEGAGFKREQDQLTPLVAAVEKHIDAAQRREDETYLDLRRAADALIERQHAAYLRWRDVVAPVSIEASAASLSGGLELLHRPGAPGDGMVVCRLRSTGAATYSIPVQQGGVYTLALHYSSPEASYLTFAVNSDALLLYAVLDGTGGWGTFRIKHVPGVALHAGCNTVSVSLTASCETPPDIARLSAQITRGQATPPPPPPPPPGNSGGTCECEASDEDTPPPLEGPPPLPPPPPPPAAAQHGEVLSILGFCHKLQLEILRALETIYADSYRHYYREEASEQLELKEQLIRKEKKDLLYMLRNIQQVRISQRQNFHCVMATGGEASVTDCKAVPFPAAALGPSDKRSAVPSPNLFAKIQQLRDGQRDSLSEAPQHVRQQIQNILQQTLNLMQREQILDLREEVASAFKAATTLLDEIAPPTMKPAVPFARQVDVHDLQAVEIMWERAVEYAESQIQGQPPRALHDLHGDDLGRENTLQLGDRLTRGVVEGLMQYTQFVVGQRHSLQRQVSALEEDVQNVKACATQDAVGAASENLELHLRVVQHLRDLLKTAETCVSNTHRFVLLARLLGVLRRVHADSPTDAHLKAVLMTSAEGAATALSDDPEDPDEPLLVWFIKQQAMGAIGFLDRCFGCAPAYWAMPQVAHEPDADARLRCKSRAVALAQAKLERLDAVMYCMLLQRAVPYAEAWSLTLTHNVQDCDLQITAHVPFYKGVFTCEDRASSDPDAPPPKRFEFIVNGQNGSVVTEYPQRSCLGAAVDCATALLRRPSTWLLLNGLAVWYRVAQRPRA